MLALLAGGSAYSQETAEGRADPVVVLDVPFLAQTESLCGGAAASMVLRYWGDSDIQAGDFPAADDAQGITTGALVGALTARGWQALSFHGDPASVRDHLQRGRPIIALLAVAAARNH